MAAQLMRSTAPLKVSPGGDIRGTASHRDDADDACPPGLVAQSPAEIPALVRRIVADYDRYRRAAARFATGWTRWHHPTRIVAEMLCGAATLDSAGMRPPAVTMPPPADRRSA